MGVGHPATSRLDLVPRDMHASSQTREHRFYPAVREVSDRSRVVCPPVGQEHLHVACHLAMRGPSVREEAWVSAAKDSCLLKRTPYGFLKHKRALWSFRLMLHEVVDVRRRRWKDGRRWRFSGSAGRGWEMSRRCVAATSPRFCGFLTDDRRGSFSGASAQILFASPGGG
jgi:hypothetical protein